MCLYPKIIHNRKYIANKKNKGNVPQAKDKRVLYVPVACGKCMECKKQKARQWQVRLTEEIRNNKSGHFMTMTFSEESLQELQKGINLTGYELDNQIATIAVRRFLERWRKKFKKSVKHWLVTELGQTSTERLHLHGIIWTDKPTEIQNIWKYGTVDTGKYVNEETIGYITKYISKQDNLHKEYNPKVLTSPGIGNNYTNRKDSNNNKFQHDKTVETYRTRTGAKINLPTYYRNKIYNDEEREQLWLNLLDKNIRWVNGTKIEIKDGDETEYYKALEQAREKNKRLGYGDNSINWERKRYENERRNLIKLDKIKKGVRNGDNME